MYQRPLFLGAILLPLLGAAPAAAADAFPVLDSERQSGSAVAYNPTADEYFVVGVRRDWFAGRTVRRAADGRVIIGPPRRLFDVGSDPAVAFDAAADLYLTAAIHCRGFGVLVGSDGSRQSPFFGVASETGCDTKALRVFYSNPRRSWIVLRRVDDFWIRGARVQADGEVAEMSPTTLPEVEFGALGDFDLAPDPSGDGFFIAWGESGDLWGQHVDLALGPAGGRLPLAAGGRNRNVAVARAGAGERLLVVWEEAQRIYGRTVDGRRLGEVIALSDRSAEAFLPVLAFNPVAGRFLLVWTEQEADQDLRARWLDDRGRARGPSFAVAAGPGNSLHFDHNAVACSERSRECLLTWNQGSPGGPARNIFGRFLEAP